MTTAEDERGILRTLAAYCQLLDDGDFEGVAALFTSDGVFAFRDEEAKGHAELAAWFEHMQPPHRRGTHVTVNPIVDVDSDRARVVSDFVFLRRIDGVIMIETAGRYRDTLVRLEDRWLLERRVTDLQLVSDLPRR